LKVKALNDRPKSNPAINFTIDLWGMTNGDLATLFKIAPIFKLSTEEIFFYHEVIHKVKMRLKNANNTS
jgi:hypothetical protein